MQNGRFGVKVKNAKNMPKTTLEIRYSSSRQETALKNN